MTSLTRRLGWGLTASLVLLCAVHLTLVAMSLDRLADNRIFTRLGHDADAIIGALTLHAEGARIDATRLGAIYNLPYSGHYFLVRVGDRVIRSRSLWDTDLAVDLDATTERQYVAGPRNQPLLVNVYRYAFETEADPVMVAVGEDLTALEEETRDTVLRYAGLWGISLILLVIGQRWIVVNTLGPLRGVRDDVAALERGDVTQLRDVVPEEVRPVVVEFNRLLDIMAQRIRRSRDGLGNLAHALKTSLTLLTQLAEGDTVGRLPEVRATLYRETERMTQLVERELKRSRLAGHAVPGQRVDLATEVAALVHALTRVYRDKPVAVAVTIPPGTRFPGDREDFLELLGNLMDNAFKWCAGRVALTVTTDAAGMTLEVADDGPGCPDGDLPNLLQRGVQADESVPGTGLGLAIANDVAASYDGTLTVGRAPELGGFRARVDLPFR